MELAIDGGSPLRSTPLPYSRQLVEDDDCAAVAEVLKSDWLTTGPLVEEFERRFADFAGARYAVAVSSGTAALHAAMHSLNIKNGDEVIVPTMTFAATVNAVLFCGGMPVFVDSDPDTLLIDPSAIEAAITDRTKAICAVDYAGQPCDYDAIREIADKHQLPVISDACHALGACYKHRAVGFLANLSTFSFHPVKPMTTGEGGMVTTDDKDLAYSMRRFRNHCLTSEHRERHEQGSWRYEVVDLGWNYRLTDFQCALGISQMKKVPLRTLARRKIAERYNNAFNSLDSIIPLKVQQGISHAYHLYVVQIDEEKFSVDRSQIFRALTAEGIGVNVHYIPVHLHPFYREKLNTREGMCPNAERAYGRILSLPIFAGMTDEDADDVIKAVEKVYSAYAR